MGEWANAAVAHFWRRMGGEDRKPISFQKGSGKDRWRMANGKVIKMADMDDQHLRNAHRMAVLQGNTGKADDLLAEINRRGL